MDRQTGKAGVLIVHLLLLCGCVSHNFAPGPGMSVVDLEPDKAVCRMFARDADPGHSFGAAGSPRFVATAMAIEAVGSAISSGIRQDENFNDCMIARGWVVADRAVTPTNGGATPASSALQATVQPVVSIAGPKVTPANLSTPALPIRQPLGIRAADVTEPLAWSLRLNPLRAGVLVLNVARQGAAGLGGMVAGDVLLRLNERNLFTVSDLRRAMAHIEPNSIILASVWRSGRPKTLQLRF